MKRALLASLSVLAFAGALGSFATLNSACSPKPATDNLRLIGPSVAEFTANCVTGDAGSQCGVSAMMERRCASLDCHGYPRRPMRIYSKYGLRQAPDPLLEPDTPPPTDDSGAPAQNAAAISPGSGDTTNEERTANYRAVIALEPEKIQDVLGTGDATRLLIYKKPLNIEHHKGGAAINKGDDSETCLVTWLKGAVDKNACGKAAELP